MRAIAITNRPGMVGCLLVGMAAAKFAPPPDPIVEELQQLDLDDITPRQAVEWLRRHKERAAES